MLHDFFAFADNSSDAVPNIYLSVGVFMDSSVWDHYKENKANIVTDLQDFFVKVCNAAFDGTHLESG